MLTAGDQINDRYELIEFIAHGGMGEVWRALDVILDREVAIKLVNSNFINGEAKLSKILTDEAKAGASLIGNPNIVTVLDFGEFSFGDKKLSYIVMELVDGPSLSVWIEKIKPSLDPKTYYYISLLIAIEVCRAIDYAHRKSILHRDIKPLNIFLSPLGLTKVGDFGLARFIDAATRTHTVWEANTPAYASPEQLKGEKGTKATDLYQLGCTLYQLFTGKMPFEKNTAASLMYAHLTEDPQEPNKINHLISNKLSDGILMFLKKEPNERDSLWQLHDILAAEVQVPYTLKVDCTSFNPEQLELFSEIINGSVFDMELGPMEIYFPDYAEVLSECMELILNGVLNVLIEKDSPEGAEKLDINLEQTVS